MKVKQPGVEPATSRSSVRHHNHYTTSLQNAKADRTRKNVTGRQFVYRPSAKVSVIYRKMFKKILKMQITVA